MSQAPVFVLAAPFSGAAAAVAMLSGHPQICAVPELGLFGAEFIGDLLDIGELGCGLTLDGLLRALAQIHRGVRDDAAIDAAFAALQLRRSEGVERLLGELATAAGPRVLLVPDTQAPLRPLDLLRLDEVVPDARWLHLTRHPYTQGVLFARSLNERLFVPPDFMDHCRRPPEIDPQIAWLRCNRNILDRAGERTPERYLRVDSEALESRPQEALAPICRWLGLDAGPDPVRAMLESQNWPFRGHGPRSAPCGLEAEFYEAPGPRLAREARADARLDRPLPWKKGGPVFAGEVQELAAAFGYR